MIANPQPRQDDDTCRPAKVLVVEDEIELAEILVHNLTKSGFEVIVAHDGLTACRLVGSEVPDVILLDILLPDLEGWEICRMVRSHPQPAIARTPVIMVTALGTADNRLRGLELGADAYIPKPYSVREMILKTDQLARKHREWIDRESELVQLRRQALQVEEWQHLLFHELRNQLLIITGYTEQLKKSHPNHLMRNPNQCIAAIDSSSSYLAELAEEFWLLRKIEHAPQRLVRKPLIAESILMDVLAIHQGELQNGTGRFSVEVRPVRDLPLNPTGLKLIISNLIGNAVKYGQGTRISILLSPQGAGWQLEVSDAGPGIAAEDLERIFTKFYRSDTARETTGGSGLGLYTARILSEVMGGSLSATSREGEGTCFRLAFPASAEKDPPDFETVAGRP